MDKAKEWRKTSFSAHLIVAFLELETAAEKRLLLEQAREKTVGRMIL